MTRLALTALLLAVAGGCRDAGDRVAEEIGERVIAGSGREAKVAIDREKGSITIDLGRAVAPDGWPDDVPIHPSAERAKLERAGGGLRLKVVASDAAAPLEGWYRTELAAGGWRIVPGGEAALVAERHGRRLRATFGSRGKRGSVAEIDLRDAG